MSSESIKLTCSFRLNLSLWLWKSRFVLLQLNLTVLPWWICGLFVCANRCFWMIFIVDLSSTEFSRLHIYKRINFNFMIFLKSLTRKSSYFRIFFQKKLSSDLFVSLSCYESWRNKVIKRKFNCPLNKHLINALIVETHSSR